MPRSNLVKPIKKTQAQIDAEHRCAMLTYNIKHQQMMTGYTNDFIASQLDISVRTFCDKKLHKPETFTIDEIWTMEKLFETTLCEPLKMADEGSLARKYGV